MRQFLLWVYSRLTAEVNEAEAYVVPTFRFLFFSKTDCVEESLGQDAKKGRSMILMVVPLSGLELMTF